jgi:hypothetical protein
MIQNQIDHIAIVMDASGSMSHLKRDVIKVVDGQIAYLARRSKELDREVRVSVYTFDTRVKCVIFDKDVLRLPSITSLYQIGDMTALIDATIQSQEDLAKTATMYGDHAFLTFVVTDGLENKSRRAPGDLANLLARQPDNFTIATLVPDHRSLDKARQYGFPADNCEIWDAKSSAGVVAAGSVIQTATDNFMAMRAKGFRSTRSLFSTGLDALNPETVAAAALVPIDKSVYGILRCAMRMPIQDFVETRFGPYVPGKAFYELSKSETIGAKKAVLIEEKATGKIFGGQEARRIIGLPDDQGITRSPTDNPLYTVFVQNRTGTRNLVPGRRVLVMK